MLKAILMAIRTVIAKARGSKTVRSKGKSSTDKTPTAFSFPAVTDAERGEAKLGGVFTVAGLGTGVVADVTVVGGQIVKNGSTLATTTTTVVNGDTLDVRLIASDAYDTERSAILTVGTVSATFSVTTDAAPVSAPEEPPEEGTDTVSGRTELLAALAGATGGEVILCDEGDYGDVLVQSKVYASTVTVGALDPANPPTFNTITLKSVQKLTFDGIKVERTPTGATISSSSIILIENCANVSFTGNEIYGLPSVNGVDPSATQQDATGNVLGWPCGRAVSITSSSAITFDGNDIHDTDRGIVLYRSTGVTLNDNEVYDLRRTALMGGASNLAVVGNYFHGSRPWRWGQTPTGDHAEFMLLFAAPGERLSNVRIAENVTSNNTGIDILGLNGGSVDGLVYEDNVLTGTDHQAIVWTDAPGAIIRRNVAIGRGQLMLRVGTTGAQLIDNLITGIYFSPSGMDTDQLAALKASTTQTNNRILQYTAPASANYLSPAETTTLLAMVGTDTPQDIRAAVLALVA